MSETPFLPLARPAIGEEEIAEVCDTLRSDWLTTGPKVQRFQSEFAAYVGGPAALALSSCTAALRLALEVLEIGPGDGVISSPLTFCSSLHVIEHAGARPVLADVAADTLNLDPEAIERAVQETVRRGIRPRALVATHLHGHPCDMDAMVDVCRRHDLALIEDAAHALPARWHGRMVGSPPATDVRWLAAFSFYATKNLTTGEGGMLVGVPEDIDKARVLSLHGMSRDAWKRYGAGGAWYYEVAMPGFKFNMTDLQAAIGLHQLRKLPEMQRRRNAIVDRYQDAFSRRQELQTPEVRPGVEHAWHIYNLRLRAQAAVNRDQCIEQLQRLGIGTSVHFIPNHVQPYYRDKYGWSPEDFPVAWREYQHMFSIPLFPAMTDEDSARVIEAVEKVLSSGAAAPAGA